MHGALSLWRSHGMPGVLAAIAVACTSPSAPPSGRAEAPAVGSAPTEPSAATREEGAHEIRDTEILPAGYVAVRSQGPVLAKELPEGRRWLADPEAWELVPPTELMDDRCYYFRSASSKRLPLPPLAWSPCGEGCERADFLQGASERAWGLSLRTYRIEDESVPYASINHGTVAAAGRWVNAERLVNLRSGRTEAGLKVDTYPEGKFGFLSPSFDLLTKGLIWTRQELSPSLPLLQSALNWDVETKRWRTAMAWQEPRRADRNCRTLLVDEEGVILGSCRDRVFVRPDPSPDARTTLTELAPNRRVVGAAAEGGLFVWHEVSAEGRGRARAWRADWEGVRTLGVEIPPETCAIALSPTRLVGLKGACYGPGELSLWWLRRVGDELGSVVEAGPGISSEVAHMPLLTTWGDHALIGGGRDVLVRLSDWTTRRLPPPEGSRLHAGTLTEDHLYLAYARAAPLLVEVDPVELPIRPVQALVRHELGRLESIGAPAE